MALGVLRPDPPRWGRYRQPRLATTPRRCFCADLRGENEVPPVDTDTRGKLRIEFAEDYSSATIRYDLEDGVRITQSHFHCGDEGVNGPVAIVPAGFHDRGWNIDARWLDNVTITDWIEARDRHARGVIGLGRQHARHEIEGRRRVVLATRAGRMRLLGERVRIERHLRPRREPEREPEQRQAH